MRKVKMPSPSGRNDMGLFLPSRGPFAAYDSVGEVPDRKVGGLSPDGYKRVMDFLKTRLEGPDISDFEKLLDAISGGNHFKDEAGQMYAAEDEPAPFKGQPKVGGTMAGDRLPSGLRRQATDATGFFQRFPSARKIGVV